MSVDRTDYIIYGWKLPYQIKNSIGVELDLWGDKFMPYIDGHKGVEFTIVRDSMSGEYTVFGIMVSFSEHDWDGWKFTDLNIGAFDTDKVKYKFKELFEAELPAAEPSLFIFSHFS